MDHDETSRARRIDRRAVFGRAAAIGSLLTAGRLGPAAALAGAPTALDRLYDVVYATIDGADLVLNITRPVDLSGLQPAVILVHGGSLIGGTRFELISAADGLAQAGYTAFNINYRLYSRSQKTHPWPAQLDDVQRAVRWVRANAATYGIDPERIGALGWSSGGQLAGFLGTRETRDNSDPALAAYSSKVSCVVTMGGTFDLTIPYEDDAEDTAVDAEVLGGSLDDLPDASAYRDFSPITFVDETSASFLILQEGTGFVVPFEHSRRMVAALQSAGVQVSYSWFPTYDHFAWGKWTSESYETLAFFGRHLDLER